MRRLFLLCGLSFLLVACLEQKTAMLLLPSGPGRLEITATFGTRVSESLLKDAKTKEDLIDASRNALAGSWHGLEFWSGESAESFAGQVSYRGTAWFRDIAKLDLTGEPCAWERRETGHEFRLCFDPLPAPGDGQTRRQQVEQMKEGLAGYRWELKASLPGDARVVAGSAVAEGRLITFRLTDADLIAGGALPELERLSRYHRFVVAVTPDPTIADQPTFEAEWKKAEKTATPKERFQSKPRPDEPVPDPPPLDPPLTMADFNSFFAVPSSAPGWRLNAPTEDGSSQTWSGSIRGTRDERIPILIRVPKEGRPCPVMIKQESWHGTKEAGQLTSGLVLTAGIAVVSFDSPFVGERKREGYDWATHPRNESTTNAGP